VKVARTVWTGGKGSDNLKLLPICIPRINRLFCWIPYREFGNTIYFGL